MKHFAGLIFLFVLIPQLVGAKDKNIPKPSVSQPVTSVGAKDKSTPKPSMSQQVIRAEIPNIFFSFRGIENLTSSVKMELRNDEVDISAVIQAIDRIKESNYDNSRDLSFIFSKVRDTVIDLCRQSQHDEEICIETSTAKLNDFYKDLTEEMSDRILYPALYYPPEDRYSDFNFIDAIDFLDSDCARKNCFNRELAVSIIEDSKAQYSQLHEKIETKNKNCQKDILQAIVKRFKFHRLPKACLKQENKYHIVCKNMLEDISTIRDRFSDLVGLAYEDEVLTTEAQANCLECVSENGNEMLKTMSDLLKALNESSQCLDLNPGEEKTVYSGTGRHRSYTVKRTQDGNYSVPLTLEFFPDKDYEGPVSKEEVPDYYMDKVQKCIKQANQKMLGPNGKRLRIAINKASKTDKCNANKTHRISIGSPYHRSNSGKYASDIDCPVVTHEILHLLGLCDEYQEKSSGFLVNAETGKVEWVNSPWEKPMAEGDVFQPAYDCRIAQTNSIMSNQLERWHFAFGTTSRRYALKGKENTRSLLLPGHFNSILYGGCPEKNKPFNECSQLAYQSSVEDENCMEKKRQCEGQNILGRNKQEELAKIRRDINNWTESKYFWQKIEKGGEKAFEKAWEEEWAGKGQKTLFMGGGMKNTAFAGLNFMIPESPEGYQFIYDHIDNELSHLNEKLKTVESWSN